MRTIKFRGKPNQPGFRSEKVEWAYGDLHTYDMFDYGKPHITNHKDRYVFEVKSETIGQFIRKDYKGKDIYEGDILETTGGYRHVVVYSHVHHTWGVVTAWEYNQYKNTIQNGVPFYEHIATPPAKEDWFEFVQARVIGNIYDTPKLTE